MAWVHHTVESSSLPHLSPISKNISAVSFAKVALTGQRGGTISLSLIFWFFCIKAKEHKKKPFTEAKERRESIKTKSGINKFSFQMMSGFIVNKENR